MTARGGLSRGVVVLYLQGMPAGRPQPPPHPRNACQRWGFAGGDEYTGTPEQVVHQLQLRAYGAPAFHQGPLVEFCAWMAGRLGAQLGPEACDEFGASVALLALLEERGLAFRLEAAVVSLASARERRGC